MGRWAGLLIFTSGPARVGPGRWAGAGPGRIDFHPWSGWRFRFRRGAQQFLRDLTLLDCEVVLYTTFSFNTLQEMADVFFKKTEGILNLTGGENYQPKYSEGVNYKLFVNSCTYQNGKGFFM